MMRSHPARWFELLTVRADLTLAVEALARTDAVELEAHAEIEAPRSIPDLQSRLDDFSRLAERYLPYWPRTSLHPIGTPRLLVETMDDALARLTEWRDGAEPIIRALEAHRAEEAELRLLATLRAQMGDCPIDITRIASAGPALFTAVFVLPTSTELPQTPASVLACRLPGEEQDFLVLLAGGDGADVNAYCRELEARKSRRVTLPPWLLDGRGSDIERVSTRLGHCSAAAYELENRLEALTVRHQIREALSDVARLEWFVEQSRQIAVSDTLGWVTGWTSDLDGGALPESLRRARVRGLLRYPDDPAGVNAPMVMRNPRWAQPFELFSRLLGIPGRGEADPSQLLAVIAPLMFGYMFGDVGQGAVLLVAGLALRRRWPAVSLLVPCGVSAMAFGVVFGSVFSREDLLAPLWLHPLQNPIPVLVAPLVGGVVVLSIGLMLNAMGAYWRGTARDWWRADAGVVALYAGLVATAWDVRTGITVALGGVLWYVAGSTWENRRDRGASLRALAHTVESALQLAVNTVSFARVGAFALAHAGVSLAIVTLADASGHAATQSLIMLIGNLVVVLIEGLVVSIQTTRLVLFEFFVRFLQGRGRALRLLRPPPTPRTIEPIGDIP